ncbi:MAG: hypothetical protein RLZZ306_521, partial [Bacteroidota bacterium]
MKYFLIIFLSISLKISYAQQNLNKTLVINYQLIKSNISASKLALKGNLNNEKINVKLLIPSGEERNFELEETTNFAPELAAKHPEIQTFTGNCSDDKMLSVRFDISPLGYSATYINQGKITIIEPQDLSKNLY